MTAPKPAALNGGTVVELRDLFYATPARLKFMRTDRAEAQAITDVVKRLAMAEPSLPSACAMYPGAAQGAKPSAPMRKPVIYLMPCTGVCGAFWGRNLPTMPYG